MPTTSPDNIYYADTATPSNDVTVSAAEATSVQAAFARRQVGSYKWANAAARNAQTGMQAGDVGDQLDIGRTFRYNGSVWLPSGSGLVPIIPTASGTGVTVDIFGRVSFSASPKVDVNNCFSAQFDAYLIKTEIRLRSVTDTYIKMRSGGTDNSVGYSYIAFFGLGATAYSTSFSAQTTGFKMDSSGGSNAVLSTNITSPFALQRTQIQSQFSTSDPTASQVASGNVGGIHSPSASYDGFSLANGAGNLTGSLAVYGYSNG